MQRTLNRATSLRESIVICDDGGIVVSGRDACAQSIREMTPMSSDRTSAHEAPPTPQPDLTASVACTMDFSPPPHPLPLSPRGKGEGVRERGDWPERIGRFYVVGEIARGGMGAVLRAHDNEFGRDLAIKVLLDQGDLSHLRQRFIDEARLTGCLQHPGIPPVHDQGKLPDGRPYFSMKLIEGSTLATLLQERKDDAANKPGASEEMPRFLAIFEQICQTLAYAHNRGVIHRDLKPSNIMVGEFGEVQVMDWGLAKRLKAPSAAVQRLPEELETRSGSVNEATDETRTHAGTVMGTLSFMAPEQARGETQLDERCDVFGLGSILCVILTGRSPYRPGDKDQLLHMAAQGDLADAWARLEDCGADGELVSLAKHCLAPERNDRPRHAGEVAAAITNYLAGVQERARQAELEQRTATLKAAEERKRARLKLSLVATALLLVLGASTAALWYQQERSSQEAAELNRRILAQHRHAGREERIAEALSQSRNVREDLQMQLAKKGGVFLFLNSPGDWQRRLQYAQAALQRAVDLRSGAESEIASELQQQFARLATLMQQDDADRVTALEIDDARTAMLTVDRQIDYTKTEDRYAAIFARFGFGLADLVGDKGTSEQIRRSAIREQLVAGLDDWARISGIAKKIDLRQRLFAIAALVQPDPFRDLLRDPNRWNDVSELQQFKQSLLADEKAFAELSPAMKVLLAAVLDGRNLNGIDWLYASQLAHPRDFWINFLLAWQLERFGDASISAGFYRAAIAVRPENALAWYNLGVVLRKQTLNDQAILTWKKALELNPRFDYCWVNIGNVRRGQGLLDEAVAAHQQALAIAPENIYAWINLGGVLQAQHKYTEAGAAFEKALAIQPNQVEALVGLASVNFELRQYDSSVNYARAALNRNGKKSLAWYLLGASLAKTKQHREAAAALRQVVAIDSKDARAWGELGKSLYFTREFAESATAYRKAIGLDPKASGLHTGLGLALCEVGELSAALDAHETALMLLSSKSKLGESARENADYCRKALEFERKLAVELVPRDVGPEFIRAELLRRNLKRYECAVRWYCRAFERSAVADDVSNYHRYNAASAALLAAANEGVGVGKVDIAEQTSLRQQALDWLRADLKTWRNLVQDDRTKKATLRVYLLRMNSDPAFAAVRDEAKLAELPHPHAEEWRIFWREAKKLIEENE